MWSPTRQAGPTKIVGPAYTVKYVKLDDPTPKLPTHYVSRSDFLEVTHVPAKNSAPDRYCT